MSTLSFHFIHHFVVLPCTPMLSVDLFYCTEEWRHNHYTYCSTHTSRGQGSRHTGQHRGDATSHHQPILWSFIKICGLENLPRSSLWLQVSTVKRWFRLSNGLLHHVWDGLCGWLSHSLPRGRGCWGRVLMCHGSPREWLGRISCKLMYKRFEH